MRKFLLTSLMVLLAGSVFAQVGGGGVVNPNDPTGEIRTAVSNAAYTVSNNTFLATNDFTGGVILVPTRSNNSDAASVAYVDAQIAAADATNQIYGSLYVDDGYDPVTIADTTTWHKVTNWSFGEASGVTQSGSNMVIAAGGEYAGIASFSMKRTAGNQDQEIEMAVFVNDSESAAFSGHRTFTSDAIGMGSLSGIGSFGVGDKIDLRFRGINVTSPNTVIGMQHANMSTWRLVSQSEADQIPKSYSFSMADTNAHEVPFLSWTEFGVEFTNVTFWTQGGTRDFYIIERPYTSQINTAYTIVVSNLQASAVVTTSNMVFSASTGKTYSAVIASGTGTNFSFNARGTEQR